LAIHATPSPAIPPEERLIEMLTHFTVAFRRVLMLLALLFASVAVMPTLVACNGGAEDNLEDAGENLGDAVEDLGDAAEDALD